MAKLREIGRKYRQETATLRRQLALNQSDGKEKAYLNCIVSASVFAASNHVLILDCFFVAYPIHFWL